LAVTGSPGYLTPGLENGSTKEFAPRAEKLEDNSHRKVIELKKASDISRSSEISRCTSRPLSLPSSRRLTNRCGENKVENFRQ
jgi:hypothetical protein